MLMFFVSEFVDSEEDAACQQPKPGSLSGGEESWAEGSAY